MDPIASIVARLCGQTPRDDQVSVTHDDITIEGSKSPWRRSPRTKANLAFKAAAMEKAISVLEASGIPYSQLRGKLVVQPPAGIAVAVSVTF